MENSELIEAETVMKDGDTPQEVIDEILRMFSDKKVSLQKIENKDVTDDMIKMKMMDETDWRKKAALSAMLISRSLNN